MKQETNTKHPAAETESRKDSHLELALSAQNEAIDPRFYYEPMLAAHPDLDTQWPVQLGDQTMQFPLWISSMTGGSNKTNTINQRLAHTAAKFGLGMGVGSARIALEDASKIKDFDLRPILGKAVPFYLNFGIAQIEKMIKEKSLFQIGDLVQQLQADGVIVHVNPLQEWMQPEGDNIQTPPLETIQAFLETIKLPTIVKEVGQGYGYNSLKALLQLPLTALEFAANGGTNFSKLELMRNNPKQKFLMPLVHVGHSAAEMVTLCNELWTNMPSQVNCKTIIISGGIKNFLDGYYLLKKSKAPAIYGQASEFLKYAQLSQEALDEFVQYQIEGLQVARTFLTLKEK